MCCVEECNIIYYYYLLLYLYYYDDVVVVAVLCCEMPISVSGVDPPHDRPCPRARSHHKRRTTPTLPLTDNL